ncbi:MAG: FtsX-like permease family protein [Pyrinomonadaceae bacterium]
MRLALGASRARIIGQLLVEGVLLAAAGGAIGLVFAVWGIDMLRSFGPESLPRLSDVRINFYVLAFTAALAALTGIVFGLVPAWQASQPDLISTLKSAGQSSAAAPSHHRLRNALVIAQVALGLVLLAGAGLLLRSFWNILAINPGFDSTGVLTAGVSLSFTDYPNNDPPRRQAFYQEALERLSALPGVESVGAISHLPLGNRTMQLKFSVDGEPRAAAHNEALADFRVVTPTLFETLRIPLKAGRVFTEHDTAQSPLVYLVNESFARTYLRGRDPLRERLRVNESLPLGDIIGVIGDLKHRGLEADATPAFYVSYRQRSTFPIMNFAIRTSIDPGSLSETVRRELQTIDRNQVVFNVRPLRQFLSDAVAQRRFSMLLLALFAGIAVSLAASGVYGVMTYLVTLKTRELGIRMALGAGAGDVFMIVLRRGLVLASVGVCVGLILALALSQVMTSLLYGVSVTDPATFAAVAGLMLGAALLACYVPARRATKVDPLVALRYE